MPMVAGSGSAKENKYYYDGATEKCIKFKYLGSGGNENNFASKSACEEACAPTPPEICTLPADRGNGTGKTVSRFMFDAKKRKCKKFKYSGEGGNANNFESKKLCKKACA